MQRRKSWLGGRRLGPLILLLAVFAGNPPAIPAQDVESTDADADAWVGERVITRYGTVLRVGDKIVDDGGRRANLSRGRDQVAFRVYKVERANGPWLWIVPERTGVAGWVKAEDLIPLDHAVDRYTDEINAHPQDPARYNARGNAWRALGELDKAIDDYSEAIQLAPQSAYAHNNRGLIWRAKNEPGKAIADFTEAIHLNPQSAYAFNNRGVAWRSEKEYDKAIDDFNEAIKLDPHSAFAHHNRGWAWFAKGEYAKAVDDFTKAVDIRPERAPARHDRGWAWYAEKEYDKAIDDYNEAIRLNPEYALAFHDRGLAWYAKADYDRALADFNASIHLNPNSAHAFNNRGNVWVEKKEYDKAIADYNEAIRLDPDFAAAHYNKALARLATGHHNIADDARASIAKADWSNKTWPIYAAIIGNLGARRAQDDGAAKTFLDDVESKADKSLWPYPVARYLKGEIDQETLLSLAGDDAKTTEARFYLAFDQLLNGRTDDARENFQWVQNHGTTAFARIAAAELDRLAEGLDIAADGEPN